jgi:hypothetical protein
MGHSHREQEELFRGGWRLGPNEAGDEIVDLSRGTSCAWRL